jgi:hypothetical protein
VKRWGLFGSQSRDWLTYGGRILWHGDQAELEFLFPVGTATVREIPADIPDDLMLPVRDHPSMAAVEWPLRRSQFRAA